jgi:hypothetical protein
MTWSSWEFAVVVVLVLIYFEVVMLRMRLKRHTEYLDQPDAPPI